MVRGGGYWKAGCMRVGVLPYMVFVMRAFCVILGCVRVRGGVREQLYYLTWFWCICCFCEGVCLGNVEGNWCDGGCFEVVGWMWLGW